MSKDEKDMFTFGLFLGMVVILIVIYAIYAITNAPVELLTCDQLANVAGMTVEPLGKHSCQVLVDGYPVTWDDYYDVTYK